MFFSNTAHFFKHGDHGEERTDENNIVYLGDNLLAGDNAIEGDGIVTDSVNKSVIEYLYGQSGVAGLVYNGVKYYFRRNIQGDVTRIYAIDGTIGGFIDIHA